MPWVYDSLRMVASADDAGGLDPQLQLLGVRVLVASADETAAHRLLAATEAQICGRRV